MRRPRIVIVGAGFAGYRTARTLARAARGRADITLLNPTDYFLYLPLLPQVAAGILEPRRVTVSLSGTLREVRPVLGEAEHVDLDARTVHYTNPEGDKGTLGYDRLVLAAGSVNKLLPIPGVAEHAHGFRGLPEALYLRDHLTRQVELAASGADAAERTARCTFVVVGAGYTGTEVAAQGQLFTDALVRAHPLRRGMRPRWLLLDVAPRVLPELDERLSRTADRVLRERGVEVRMGTSVKEATRDGVLLTDGEFVATRTLAWCVGVRPDPLAESLGLPMERGRLLVEPTLQVPGRPEVFACGDAAAVPDLEKPGEYTPMTAQHAWRQGKVAGQNVAASLVEGGGPAGLRPYRHKDMGFVVDLGGVQAAANPLGVHLSGPAAGAVARGYHLAAMPGNRVRVAADWLLDAVLPRQDVQLGLVRSWSVPLDTASPELARMPGENGRQPAASGPGAATAADAHDAHDADVENADVENAHDQNADDKNEGNDVNDVNDVNETKKATGGSGEHHPAPEDGSQSITAPTPEVGQHSGGGSGSRVGQSSPEEGSQSIDSPTPEVGRHSDGPAAVRTDRTDGTDAGSVGSRPDPEAARKQSGRGADGNDPAPAPGENTPVDNDPAEGGDDRAEGGR
ncbi:NAD(P)/FAD-dependent oxidoreductase [Streptomyces rishiriensis]|uniref:NADH dehydrogenase n=1 Tax=Streptomyces rishiriensis TaxID=68264 RepID=A0ABU0NZA1_STRRH|nr:NAD(P)/FAD-dependent oxidoreductase [Streptomyces rishiriensis]MDQ0584384.1 NADH dehydrogenase [Streptomyces rishiriensis]